jgi:hypothetical protein
MVTPRFPWLTYNEPEGHLDALVTRLSKLAGLGHTARIVGLTYKDDTTLTRFNALGFRNTYRLDLTKDLAVQDPAAGLETIQAALDPGTARRVADKHGAADLLLVRHVLEHAHNPMSFVAGLRTLVKPGGYLVFEVPDSGKFLQACDYTFIWEEHIAYFTAQTLAALIDRAGLELAETTVYPYPLEDSLVAIVCNDGAGADRKPAPRDPAIPLAQGTTFARRYAQNRVHIRSLLQAWRQQQKRIAIFGAGHLAVKFVNMYALQDLIDCAIDEHPDKQQLLMPGSRLPIGGSDALQETDICLLALSPESEQKVLAKFRLLREGGTRFLSIFALNPNSIYNAEAA